MATTTIDPPTRKPRAIPTDQDALLRPSEVLQLCGFGRTKLWQLTKKGDFPAPVSIGGERGIGWPRRVVLAWLTTRPTA